MSNGTQPEDQDHPQDGSKYVLGWQIHYWAYTTAAATTLIAIIISIIVIIRHLRRYVNPPIQKSVVRIIMIAPVYAVDSYISLVLHYWAMYIQLVRVCYEAYVVFVFLRLCIELAEGEENLVMKLEETPQIRWPVPFCCFHIKPGRVFLHRCKQMILQYVVLKPIIALIIFMMQVLNVYEEGDLNRRTGYMYIEIILSISITLSAYFFLLFYIATKSILEPYRPTLKFLCIEGVILLSFWQGIVFSILARYDVIMKPKDDWSAAQVATGVHNAILCYEMLPFAIAFAYTFSYSNFEVENQPHLLQDLPNRLIHNMLDVANIRDVCFDTWKAMKRGPSRKVYAGDFLSLDRDKQIDRILHQGWLEKRGEDVAKIWKKRFVCLIDKPLGLIYFKTNPYMGFYEMKRTPIKARGFIDFESVTEVKARESLRFDVITQSRKWHFRAQNEQEREEWCGAMSARVKNWEGELREEL